MEDVAGEGGTAVEGVEVEQWYGFFAPAKTPKPIIDQINKALNQVVADPEMREKLLAQGSEGVGGSPETLGKVVAAELPKWAKLVHERGITAE